MAFKERIKRIKKIEDIRGSTVICYLTSIRPNLPAQMSEDAVRVFFDQMLLLPKKPVEKIDIFLCSNGGSGTVPWRLISLLREYAKKIGVLIPYRAYSAATLLALGADEIVMHPFAEMGPIDPTVTNDYNPIDPQTQRRLGISVEDVKAFIGFAKNTVGIQHEDELVKLIEILIQKVHPLALGNVERFISQSRLIARKILLTHMDDDGSKHKIDEIIETMASKLYFHGHPINRLEARKELGLKVIESITPALETAIWDLYLDFEQDMENRIAFDPMSEIFKSVPPVQFPIPMAPETVPAPITPQTDEANPTQQGESSAPTSMPQLMMVPGQGMTLPFIPPGIQTTMELTFSMVESAKLSARYTQKKRFVVVGTGQMNEPLVRDETLAQGWHHTLAPVQVARKTRR